MEGGTYLQVEYWIESIGVSVPKGPLVPLAASAARRLHISFRDVSVAAPDRQSLALID